MIKLSRSKSSVADAKKQCEFLKKESKKLEGKLEELETSKAELLQIEETLKVHYICTKVQNEEEFQRNNIEHEELLKLRNAKKAKLREKEIILKDTEKLTNELGQLVKQRECLEESAGNLNTRLDQVSMERAASEAEAKKNQEILKGLSAQLAALKNERENLNRAVATTFEEELRVKKNK